MAKKSRSVKLKETKSSKVAKTNYGETLNVLEESFKFDDAVRDKTNQRIRLGVIKSNDFIQKAKKALAQFNPSKVSAEIRKEATYLIKGSDLKAAQNKIISDRISQMKEHTANKGLRLDLSDDDVKTLGLDVHPERPETFLKAPQQIIEKLQGTGVLINWPSSSCLMRAMADGAVNDIVALKERASTPSIATAKSEIMESGTSILAAEELVSQNVSLQMQHATAPEESIKFGITNRATQNDISEMAKTFELSGGPADVVSYHDFYDLQIAFHHVWTELFDGKLAEAGENIYKELVRMKDDYGIEMTNDPITSVEELKKLMTDYRSSLQTVSGNDARLKYINQHMINISAETWYYLDSTTQDVLYSIALDCATAVSNKDLVEAVRLAANASTIIQKSAKKSRVENFLDDLEQRLTGKYTFDVFAPNSMNYGILVNYKQRWQPLAYQVGELVSTIPLAPKEIRKYAVKRIVKKNRATKEIENSLNIRKEESSETARVDAEIVRQANNKTNFKNNAEGGVNFEVWNAKGSHGIEVDAERRSSDTKKEFRESVLKAAEEYKHEHSLDISISSSEEIEETSSGEISNPNDELPVTYLFYELQRRYEISEKIHKITPVILIANDVPSPDEIDEGWLLANDWILKRVILDDSFLPALDYLSQSFVSDEITVEVLRDKMLMQIDLVKSMGKQVNISNSAYSKTLAAMEGSIEAYAASKTKTDKGFIADVDEFFTGGDVDNTETLRIRMEAAKEALSRVEQEQKEKKSLLESEINALEVATDKFINCVKDQFNRKTAILRLRGHVRDNILFYMQAIWDQEPPDQRFFRLYNLDVPDISIQNISVAVNKESHDSIDDRFVKGKGRGKRPYRFKIVPDLKIEKKKLVEVADLDKLLGYKGNYMIFPLKKNNAITMYMMQDYIQIDELAHLRDPDDMGNYTSDELLAIIKCQYEKSPEAFTDEAKTKLRDLLIKRLSDPYREKDMIIVPTKSLYIEALPGKHPILEDFKLVHRAVDVKKVQAEVRHAELENIRLAARALKGEHEDPDIEKKIIVEGNTKNILIDAE